MHFSSIFLHFQWIFLTFRMVFFELMSLEDERVQECFRHLGINVENHTADELFELFDIDEDGKIDPYSFDARPLKSL